MKKRLLALIIVGMSALTVILAKTAESQSAKTTLKKVIAEGNFGLVDPQINDGHFPLGPDFTAPVTLVLVSAHDIKSFGVVTTEDILEHMKKNNLIPAEVSLLLKYSKENVAEHLEYAPIVALGSRWIARETHHYCPELGEINGKRTLTLAWINHSWPDNYRFLAWRRK